MINIIKMFKNMMLNGEDVLNPVYEGITAVAPMALTLVFVLSLFYGIFLGTKYAQAKSAEDKANTQRILVNFVIGVVIVITLIAIVYAIRGPIASFIDGN